MDSTVLEQAMHQAEKYFKTAEDQDQIQVSMDSWKRIEALNPDALAYRLAHNGTLQGWALTIPTTRELMERFLAKQMSEKELLLQTKPQDSYDALYLAAAFVLPECRRQGMALELLKESIEKAPTLPGAKLFAWGYSEEGKALAKKLGREIGQEILLRE
ncbi:hypothetical protein JW711_02055 [Candidatus Woesearchaeota archaeon]|nr:hypothetical protein [Candidatus Woesearchaeota archaeon]